MATLILALALLAGITILTVTALLHALLHALFNEDLAPGPPAPVPAREGGNTQPPGKLPPLPPFPGDDDDGPLYDPATWAAYVNGDTS